MALSWKFLLPLSLVNLTATTLEVFFLRDSAGTLATTDLWIMTGINVPLALGCIFLFGILVRDKTNALAAGPTKSEVLNVAGREMN